MHHIEVFHCEVPAGKNVRFYNGPGQSEGMPTELEFCRKVIGAWAMGATVGLNVGLKCFHRINRLMEVVM